MKNARNRKWLFVLLLLAGCGEQVTSSQQADQQQEAPTPQQTPAPQQTSQLSTFPVPKFTQGSGLPDQAPKNAQ